MTDFEKMIKTLVKSGRIEGEGFTAITYDDRKVITIYKLYFTDCGGTEDIEFHFEYDTEGNLKEVW